MDLPWGDDRTRKFVTNVGLITSNGLHGHNVMAVEWTNHVSYSPGLIAIHLGRGKTTGENIESSKAFGVSLAASDQNVVSSVAGGYSGRDVDKVAILKELGVEFSNGKKVDVLLVEGAAMQAECKLVKSLEIGDHKMYVGEVQEATSTDKLPLILSQGKYWTFGEQVKKPEGINDKVADLAEKHKRSLIK